MTAVTSPGPKDGCSKICPVLYVRFGSYGAPVFVSARELEVAEELLKELRVPQAGQLTRET